jgi:hypothetical protein
MSEAAKFKAVDQKVPDPFGNLEINVCPVSIFGRAGVIGHSVGVMDRDTGQGHRTGLERAEAEARAVLKAIRAYRRRNAALLSPEPIDPEPNGVSGG